MKKLLNFIEGDKGERSSRRLGGIFLLFSGGCSKLCLIWFGAKIKLAENFTIYEKLDATAYSLIVVGGLLLGATTFDKFRKK